MLPRPLGRRTNGVSWEQVEAILIHRRDQDRTDRVHDRRGSTSARSTDKVVDKLRAQLAKCKAESANKIAKLESKHASTIRALEEKHKSELRRVRESNATRRTNALLKQKAELVTQAKAKIDKVKSATKDAAAAARRHTTCTVFWWLI